MLVELEEPSPQALPALLTPFPAQTPSLTPAPMPTQAWPGKALEPAGDETHPWYRRSHLKPGPLTCSEPQLSVWGQNGALALSCLAPGLGT